MLSARGLAAPLPLTWRGSRRCCRRCSRSHSASLSSRSPPSGKRVAAAEAGCSSRGASTRAAPPQDAASPPRASCSILQHERSSARGTLITTMHSLGSGSAWERLPLELRRWLCGGARLPSMKHDGACGTQQSDARPRVQAALMHAHPSPRLTRTAAGLTLGLRAPEDGVMRDRCSSRLLSVELVGGLGATGLLRVAV